MAPEQESSGVDEAEQAIHSLFGDPSDWNLYRLRKLLVIDRLISPQTLMQFGDCIYEGWLPGGGRTKYPLMRDDELALLNSPFSAWAPAPWNKLNHSIMDQQTRVLSSVGLDILGMEIPVPARVQTLKARLWGGMVPMTGVRWKEKKLDDPKNFQQFYDLTLDIILIFKYLDSESVRSRMRQTFNWLSDEFGKFESAINARRAATGVSARMNIVGMWAEFMKAVLTTMSTRTHQWIVDRNDEIQMKSKIEYVTAVAAAGDDMAAVAAVGKAFFERVQDLNLLITRTDIVCSVSMEGFIGDDPSTTGVNDVSHDLRQEAYHRIADTMSWEAHTPFADHTDRHAGLLDSDALMLYFDESRRNRAAIRKQFRGEPRILGEEHWITILKSRISWYLKHGGDPDRQTWGFVCYRITYRQTPEEWADFKTRFEADLMKSGQWVEGADSVKGTAGLQWIDGRDFGIAEGDIAAAKRHFATFPNSETFMRRMWKTDFLAVDYLAYWSYNPESRAAKSAPLGDDGGHVRLVDMANYDPQLIKETSPGFTGDFNVLSTLVFDEIYPLLVTLAQRPRDLWPLARLHPRSIYVGPTVRCQEEEWELQREIRADMQRGFFEHMRQNGYRLG